ncbi:hypothetical protein QMZ92_13260 [Streptomyces sp. HNM0645]|uniref:hypothetical protein n=1 Tax=Streptomyces sp. HNM0645 TaxID=2782343 RepID=UPI0024B8634A|nr:hypothetical protein [Streptomyces sp. HNM0645]MDI9885336.1 hypothetical protein [Streptomyces sp. HNM0645]
MTTTATHLRTIATLWTDLRDALGAPAVVGGFGKGLRGYLATLEEYDLEEARVLRALERDPAQIGQRPIPMDLAIYDTMHTVRATLADCADHIAGHVQRNPIQPPPPRRAAVAHTRAERLAWSDHARRVQAAQDDAADPRRWRHGSRPDAPYTALWLYARVVGAPGPFRRLAEEQLRTIASVAAGSLRRMETALDLADQRRELSSVHPCQCGGTIEVYGGAGAQPVARCKACGALWTERGIIASRTAVTAA